MKRFYTNLKAMATKMLAVALVGVAAVSCAEAYDDTDLQNKVADLTERVTTLEERLDSEVAALRALIDEKVALAEAAADGAWKFTLADGKTLTVYPQYVNNGITVVTVGGVQYWAQANGAAEPVLLKDANGNPVEVVNAPEVRVNAEGNVEVSVDGGATWVACEGTPGLFAAIDVKENHACLTLQSGEVLKFALYEQVNFNINGNALFIAPAASEKVTMTLDGIVEIIPLVVPKGWDISIDGLIMTVTAPAVVEADEEMGGPSVGPLSLDDDMGVGDDMGVVAPAGEAGAASGAVKVLAVSKEGKVVVATLKVTATEMYTSLKVVGDDVVLTNNNYFENRYGDLMPMDLAYAIFPTNEYTIEEFVASNAGYPSTFKYEVGYYDELGTVTFKATDLLKELCGIESVKRGDSFTVVAFDPNAYPLTADVIMKDVYAVTYLDVEVGEATFKDANINITLEGYSGFEVYIEDTSYDSYYGPQERFEELIAMVKKMQDWGYPESEIERRLQNMSWGIRKDGNYSGSIFALNSELEPKANNTYAVYIWPKVALKSVADYTWEDVKGPYYVKTKNYSADGMLQPTFGLVDNWGDILPEATYQTVNVAVIPAEGAYMTYGHYFEPKALEGMSDADIVAEVLKNGSVRIDEPVNVMAEGLKPGTTVAVVGFCVDQNGKYGPIIKKEVTTKNLDYSTATIEITDFVVTPSYGMSTDDANYSFNVKVNGEVSPIYFCLVEVNENMNVEGTAAELAVAILNKDTDPTLSNNYLDIAVLPKDDAGKYAPYGQVQNLWGGTDNVGLESSKEYMIVVGGVGADGLPTNPVYHKFDTFPTLTMIYADDAKWAATKPVVKVSEKMTATYLYADDYAEGELTGEALTYPLWATKEITITLAEGCTEFVVGCHGSDYTLGKESLSARVWLDRMLTNMQTWPTFESEYDKVMSSTYYHYTGEAKEVTFTSAEFGTNITSYLDIAWKDAEGNWYESFLELLHEEYFPEGLPNTGGGGIAM